MREIAWWKGHWRWGGSTDKGQETRGTWAGETLRTAGWGLGKEEGGASDKGGWSAGGCAWGDCTRELRARYCTKCFLNITSYLPNNAAPACLTDGNMEAPRG